MVHYRGPVEARPELLLHPLFSNLEHDIFNVCSWARLYAGDCNIQPSTCRFSKPVRSRAGCAQATGIQSSYEKGSIVSEPDEQWISILVHAANEGNRTERSENHHSWSLTWESWESKGKGKKPTVLSDVYSMINEGIWLRL
jgi:hypothetical protein